MKIAVCLKMVPDANAEIHAVPGQAALCWDEAEMIFNPCDEFALEAALQARKQFAGSTVLALAVGGEVQGRFLRHALALLADHALHIQAEGLDAAAAARLAAAALKPLAPDIVLCGRQAADDDQWLFPGMLAELLDCPHLTAAATMDFSPDGSSLHCRQRVAGGERTLRAVLPAVVSCDKGLNAPRVPTLRGRLDAKNKKPESKTPAELGFDAAALAPGLTVLESLPPPRRTGAKMIGGTSAQAARELLELLAAEARVLPRGEGPHA